ncbi:unnamed protein product [marine sediment metagenome]|uniref:Uncharacterized protein n=1 Tax=marine sediment metagenome TaxID=412755 RepID=X0WA60_9ZZZZ
MRNQNSAPSPEILRIFETLDIETEEKRDQILLQGQPVNISTPENYTYFTILSCSSDPLLI